MRIACGIAAVLWLAACATPPPAANPLTRCADPRPQVCTMQYDPACATLIAGGVKEYSSGCNACADDAVAGYEPGPCPE